MQKRHVLVLLAEMLIIGCAVDATQMGSQVDEDDVYDQMGQQSFEEDPVDDQVEQQIFVEEDPVYAQVE